MRTFVLLVTILSATARADDDGSALVVAGYSTISFAAGEAVAAIGLLAAAANQPEGAWNRTFLGFGGAMAGTASMITAAIGTPILAKGLNRQERKARVGVAPMAQGAMVGVSGSF